MTTPRQSFRSRINFLLFPSVFVCGLALGWGIAYFSGLSPSVVPLGAAALALVVAFGVPLWQAHYINRPSLGIEISSIRRTISETATISITDDPELKAILSRSRSLPHFWDDEIRVTHGRSGETVETLAAMLEAAKQRLRDLPTLIEDRKRVLDQIKSTSPANMTKFQVDSWNAPISPEIDYDPSDTVGMHRDFIQVYQSRLDKAEKDYADLQINLPTAERKVESLTSDLVRKNSLFTVSVSLINSGKSNTAIKVPALLRVLIGEGNYIDIKLSLKDFETKSEIPASGTRIAIFESLEISSLPEEDRSLINTYWGQSVRAWLLVEDIHGNILRSGYIAFAEGLYQKIIYDRLARAASGREV